MKRTIFVFVLGMMVFAFAAAAGEFTGHISDSKCGATHSDHSEKSIKCVNGCVKNGGQKPVFVTEDGKVVKIANPDKVMGHLGHEVKITGKMEGDTLTVEGVRNVAP